MKNKKSIFSNFLNTRAIGFRIFLMCLIGCIFLVGTLMLIFSDVTVKIGENFTESGFRECMDYMIYHLNTTVSSRSWVLSDGCLYKGDTKIGDGTEENAATGLFDGTGNLTENYCYVAKKDTDGNFVIVSGTFSGDKNYSYIGYVLSNSEKKSLDDTGSCTGRRYVRNMLIFSYSTVIRDANNNVVGALIVAQPMDYIYSTVKTISLEIFAVTTGLILLIFVIVFIASLRWTSSIATVNEYFKRIGDGEIPDEKLEVSKYAELSAIADNVNNMVEALKTNERISAELNIAAEIQSHMLPSVFPPFPDIKEFEIFASMTAAKEVGGDFYDFFMVDNEHLGFCIADVSGKGIPAAMFMVTARTLIKDHCMLGLSPSEVFERVNNILCDGNEAQLFVTAWLGILDITSGELKFVNAGHNPPIVGKNGSSEYQYLRSKPCLVLSCIEDMEYETNSIILEEGQRLFLYTDGITEAMNKADELYGEERLLAFFNNSGESSVENITKNLKMDIDGFVADAEQSDDMTMLVLDFTKKKNEIKMSFPASDEQLDNALDFVEAAVKTAGFPDDEVFRLRLATEEIFVNIAHYAYSGDVGDADIAVKSDENKLYICFTDRGIPFNPLENSAKNVDVLAESEQIGGLGIFLAKKVSDELIYEHKNGKNILTLIKNLPKGA